MNVVISLISSVISINILKAINTTRSASAFTLLEIVFILLGLSIGFIQGQAFTLLEFKSDLLRDRNLSYLGSLVIMGQAFTLLGFKSDLLT